jgi:hypothetical protein
MRTLFEIRDPEPGRCPWVLCYPNHLYFMTEAWFSISSSCSSCTGTWRRMLAPVRCLRRTTDMSHVRLGPAIRYCVGSHGHEMFSTPELSTSPPPSPSSGISTAATDQVPRWSTHPPNVNYQRSTNCKHRAQVGTTSLALGPRAPSGHLLLCELSSSWVRVKKLSMTKSAISRPNR